MRRRAWSCEEKTSVFLHCLISQACKARFSMNANHQAPISEILEDLRVVSSHIGLSLDDLKFILASGVTLTELLDYLEAVVSNRLN